MTDTDTTFCFPPSAKAPSISGQKQQLQTLKMDTRFFQNPKVMHQNYPEKQQSSIWSMIHSRGDLFTTVSTTSTTTKANHHQKPTAIGQQNKGLVAVMQEQLELLTTDLVQQHQHQQQQQQVQLMPTNEDQRMRDVQSDSFWDYLDALERVDREEEHLAAPVYFTGTEMEEQRKKEQKNSQESSVLNSNNNKDSHGFLPSAFNSLRNLVGNVFRLPSLIMGTWNVDSSPSTPEHHHHHQQYIDPRTGRSAERKQDHSNHLFFDVDDIDFLPETSDGACQFETFYVDDNDNASELLEMGCEYRERDNNRNRFEHFGFPTFETKHTGDCDSSKPTTIVDPETSPSPSLSLSSLSCGGATEQPHLHGLDNRDGQTVEAVEIDPPKQQQPVPDENALQKRSNTAAMDINIKSEAKSEPCIRRFVCTPDQELSRMAVVGNGRRKRQQVPIKAALVSRSTPIAMKTGGGGRTMPSTRALYHPSKRTLNKNRKEKKRHEIATNIHEDYEFSSDSEAGHESSSSQWCLGRPVHSDTEDDDLLPLTARNLMEPSCLIEFLGESSMNSSAGSGSTSGREGRVPRRNSINFQSASAYEKEFPAIGGLNDDDDEAVVVVPRGLVTKKNAVYFEIPNSPQRRRMMMGQPPKMKPKMRTNSVMSSSVGSSPATSFDAGGKFWGHHQRTTAATGAKRERTVSECSDDDLIEFVSEGGAAYLPEVFSDDEDYSSGATTESESEEEWEEDGKGDRTWEEEDEDDGESDVCTELNGGRLQSRRNCSYDVEDVSENSQLDDLPDSGLEEKRVREEFVFVLSISGWNGVNFDRFGRGNSKLKNGVSLWVIDKDRNGVAECNGLVISD